MADLCAPKVWVPIGNSEYRESLRADLDALYRSTDITEHLDVSALRPFEDPPEVNHA